MEGSEVSYSRLLPFRTCRTHRAKLYTSSGSGSLSGICLFLLLLPPPVQATLLPHASFPLYMYPLYCSSTAPIQWFLCDACSAIILNGSSTYAGSVCCSWDQVRLQFQSILSVLSPQWAVGSSGIALQLLSCSLPAWLVLTDKTNGSGHLLPDCFPKVFREGASPAVSLF